MCWAITARAQSNTSLSFDFPFQHHLLTVWRSSTGVKAERISDQPFFNDIYHIKRYNCHLNLTKTTIPKNLEVIDQHQFPTSGRSGGILDSHSSLTSWQRTE
ncbi:hypothetical protein IAS59_006118 [Cryptococcus gattii]